MNISVRQNIALKKPNLEKNIVKQENQSFKLKSVLHGRQKKTQTTLTVAL